MPNILITDRPVRLTQSTVSTPTLLSNISNVAMYLGVQSSVSDTSYDHLLTPGKQILWPADKQLFGVTATGDTGQLTVLPDAEGMSATEVGIIGPVDVDITNPVNVQGGGVILFNDEIVIPAGGVQTVNIPGPSNGLTFYGIDVSWELLLSSLPVTASVVEVAVNGVPGTDIVAIPARIVDANEIGELGNIEFADFMTPMKTSFPLTVRVRNSQPANTLTGFLRVTGTAYSFPYPIDSEPRPAHLGASLDNASAGQYVSLAASFNDQRYRLTMFGNATAGNVSVDVLQSNGTWLTTEVRPHLAYFGGFVSTTGMIEPNSKSEFIIPGNGRVHRLRVVSAITGSVRLSYAGKAS